MLPVLILICWTKRVLLIDNTYSSSSNVIAAESCSYWANKAAAWPTVAAWVVTVVIKNLIFGKSSNTVGYKF
jgi:hypothetical protein